MVFGFHATCQLYGQPPDSLRDIKLKVPYFIRLKMSKVNCQEGVQIPNSPFPRIENRKFKESRTSLLGNRHDPTLKRAVKTLEMHHLCRESYFSLCFFLSSVWTLSWLIEIELHLRREAGDGMMARWWDCDMDRCVQEVWISRIHPSLFRIRAYWSTISRFRKTHRTRPFHVMRRDLHTSRSTTDGETSLIGSLADAGTG